MPLGVSPMSPCTRRAFAGLPDSKIDLDIALAVSGEPVTLCTITYCRRATMGRCVCW